MLALSAGPGGAPGGRARRAGAGPAAPPGPVRGGFREFDRFLAQLLIGPDNLQGEIDICVPWMGLVGLVRL